MNIIDSDIGLEKVNTVICGGITDQSELNAQISLDELEKLVYTAGGEVKARLTQRMLHPSPAYYFGLGKIEYLSFLCSETDSELVVFDDELTPTQIRNIEKILPENVKCIDRSMLILDIFASHARSREGKLQVEYAQLKYTVPRLSGKGEELSRLGGGIGSRGPGESKLETDRRHINRRLYAIEKELSELKKKRLTLRKKRNNGDFINGVIIGYTNAGKSTLLNRLTDSDVLEEDKLFATLDTTTRRITTSGGNKILLTDTVGFIRNIPHHLIESFKSTLEEIDGADIILFVLDASDPDYLSQIEVTENVLSDYDIKNKKILYIFNKCDLDSSVVPFVPGADIKDVVYVSAKTGEGMEKLLDKLSEIIQNDYKKAVFRIPLNEGNILSDIIDYSLKYSVEYTDDSILLKADTKESVIRKHKDYLVK